MSLKRRMAAGLAAAAAISVLGVASPSVADDRRYDRESRADRLGSGYRDDDGTTTVVLNQAIVPALVDLGVAPVRPGTLSAPGGTYQVAFPITDIDDGRIEHGGGLTFGEAAAGDLSITRFVIDTGAGVLSARAEVDGQRIGRIPVFALGAVQEVSPGVIPACGGVGAGLTLTPEAAAALGVPAGLFIGDACVVPEHRDDDDDDDRDDDRDDDDRDDDD